MNELQKIILNCPDKNWDWKALSSNESLKIEKEILLNELLDNALKSINSDYEAKRYNNITLNKPKIVIARTHLFYDWLKQQDKLGGQHKVPRLSNSRDYLDVLLKMNS